VGKEKEMKKKLIWGAVGFFLIAGCAVFDSIEVKEQKYGKASPVIEQSFAPDRLNPGDQWRIYIRASDPDGDMETIIAVVEQVGLGSYPVSLTDIKEENGKELSGYVYLNTGGTSGSNFLFDQKLTVSIQIRDKAEHTSNSVTHSVVFLGRQTQKSPPAGVFKEKDLGPIMISLRPGGDRR
jgi:hypothetical protein